MDRGVLQLWLLLQTLALHCPWSVQAAEAGEKLRVWPDNLFGVAFPTPETGFISGYGGTLLRTDDGGTTWAWSQIGVNELVRRIAFVDAERGWAVGHRGSILHTSDGGSTWSVQAQQQGTYLRDVAFADSLHGWVVGHGATILATRDGGVSWHSQKLTGFKGRDLPRLHAVSTIDASRAMLVGEFGVAAYTADGGGTWQVFDSGTKKTLLALAHLGGGTFLGAGLDGTLVRLEPAATETEIMQKPDANAKVAELPAQHAIPGAIPPVTYVPRPLDAGTTEHFLALSAAGDGRAVATGRAVLSMIVGEEITRVPVDDSIQLAFTWFGGAEVTSDGQFWLVGIRGTIAGGSLSDGGRASLRAALGRSESIRFAQQIDDAAEARP